MAEHSVTGAVAVAGQVGGDVGQQLALAAEVAYVDGLHTTSLVAAGFALVGSLIALVLLPARARARADSGDEADPTPIATPDLVTAGPPTHDDRS